MHRLFRFIIAFMLMLSIMASAQVAAQGDRITSAPNNLAEWIPASLPRDTYGISPGDTLMISVRGKANLNYHIHPAMTPGENAEEIQVSPGGEILLPLIGEVKAADKTVVELEHLLRTKLGEYFKNFEVSVSVSKVRTINVWISGEVEKPGPQILPAVSTVSLAALQAGIKPTGSTRRIALIRGTERKVVDLYKMAVSGSIEEDIPLQPGDSIHVPPATDCVEVSGELIRPGRYEMVCLSHDSMGFHAGDLVQLALGAVPSAALDKAFIERIGEGDKKKAINVNLRNDSDLGTALQSGDVLVIPSISAFQPMIRLIGEFKGDGVYQRAPTTNLSSAATENVQNKSGIYFLKQGQTVMDVITVTGGVTPQADLKRAYVDRRENGIMRQIPIDLERLLVDGDKTADVALMNGDTIVLPAVADKIQIFGEVNSPGSYIYSPNRRLIDYVGNAGGPTGKAKLNEVSVVRVVDGKPNVIRLNAKNAMRGTSVAGNPILEPGDIVYVPSKFVSDWRDAIQLVFTGLSLSALLRP